MRAAPVRLRPAAAILALLIWPTHALATLDGSLSGSSAGARFTGSDLPGAVTPFLDHVDVSLANAASESFDPGPTYLGDFEYQATIAGSGTVAYGSASGGIETDAMAGPQSVEPAPGNPNGPLFDLHGSTVNAIIRLDFQEDGVVTGGGAPGTPVSLGVNFLIQSTSLLVEGHPSFDRIASARFNGRIIDESNGFMGVERDVNGSQLLTVDFDTAVGHTLSIEGHLYLTVEGLAGSSQGASGYVGSFIGAVNADVAGLWVDAPDGVEIVAPSGHDYTVPVPEAGRPLLLLLAAGSLFLRRAWAPLRRA